MAAVPPLPAATLATAYRDPDAYVLRWHREGSPFGVGHFLALALTALAGTAVYGALLGWGGSWPKVGEAALLNSLASAIAWAAPLPALYILGGMTGLKARASTVFLASLTTAAWGGMALLAMAPIAAVFLASFPDVRSLALFIHGVTLLFVAGSMACVFGRIVDRLDPGRGGGRVWWLALFVLLKVQLLNAFGVIRFDL